MKPRKILLLLVLINLLLFVVSACSKEVVETDIEIRSFNTIDENEIVVENNNLSFHFDPVTTQFYVVNKKTGYTWYSNPVDVEDDVLAQGRLKKEIQSTITIRYNTESGSATSMNNFESSIEKGNYTFEQIENGVKVNYSIGNIDKVYYIPIAVPESRFMEFFEQLDKGNQGLVRQSYQKLDYETMNASAREENLQIFPDLEEEPIWLLREGTKPFMKQIIQDHFGSVGYTREDYELDAERYEVTSTSNKPIFNVSIIYELEDDGLRVSIPMNEIQYRKRYPIVEIKPLAFFGAGNNTSEGFIIVPEGSGGLINFNNKKSSQNAYTSGAFGWDYGISRKAVIDETRVNFPMFGISNGEESFISIVQSGSAYARIEADVAGRMNSYNSANASFQLITSEIMDISAKSDRTVRMFQEALPDEMITQKYIFIDKNDYPSMAIAYREYLMDTYPELVRKTEANVPVAIELIGAIDRTQHVLGVPVKKPFALTKYNEAVEIVEQLLEYGISDINVKYNGWFNEGIQHETPNRVKLISTLGSKKDFKNMVKFMNDNDVNLYLEATFQFVYNNSMTDNFITIRDAAKHVNRKIVELYPYHDIWFGQNMYRDMYYLAKPSYYMANMDTYAKEISKLGVRNIAFGDIGRTLSSDFNPKNPVSREAVLNLHKEKMAELRQDGFGMMINSGNIYAVPYADFIVDMNLSTKGYNIIDEEIPFIQIALHGLVSYAGRPINLAEDFDKNLLKTIETGAGLYFVLMAEDSFALQDSNYTHFFSSDFNIWAEDINELYNRFRQDLGHIYNQFIVDHQTLAAGVTMTTYEDGTNVIVNYNENSYIHNGKEVLPKNYIVEGGKR